MVCYSCRYRNEKKSSMKSKYIHRIRSMVSTYRANFILRPNEHWARIPCRIFGAKLISDIVACECDSWAATDTCDCAHTHTHACAKSLNLCVLCSFGSPKTINENEIVRSAFWHFVWTNLFNLLSFSCSCLRSVLHLFFIVHVVQTNCASWSALRAKIGDTQ